MSDLVNLIPTPPTSVVRNTAGKGNEQILKNLKGPASDAALREYCDKYYHQLLPIIAEKVHKEKVQREKLKEVKACLNFEGCSGRNSKVQKVSQHSESITPNVRGEHGRGQRSGHSRSMSKSPEPTSVFSRIRRGRSKSARRMLNDKGRKEGGVFNRLGGKGKNVFTRSESRYQSSHSGRNESVPRKRHHECSRRTETLSESEDSRGDIGSQGRKDQSQALKRTAYHNRGCVRIQIPSRPVFATSTSQKRPGCQAFLANFLQQKKFIKDHVEIHHIKQKEGESTKDFVQRFKTKSRHVKGAPECMRISGFMHGITKPELIKRLHDNIPKLVDEMMRVSAAFLRGEVVASNQARKKTLPAWKQQETGRKQNFDKRGDFRNQQRSERRCDKFILLTKSLREILAFDKGGFKTLPPINIEEMVRAGKLSHVIKELKQGNGEDQPKASKKGEASGKDKALAILMVQPWQRAARQRITQSFSPDPEISFSPLVDEDEMEGPMAPSRSEKPNGSGHRTPHWLQWRNYIANGTNITTSEIWDAKHSTSTWMNFVVVRSSSPHNEITGRPQIIPLECTMVSEPKAQPSAIARAVEERIKVAIHPEYPEQTIAIGSTLMEEGRKELCHLLRRNMDIFTWKPAEMTFLSKSAEKSPLFFKTLKKCMKKSEFQWTAKAEAAFKQMKKLIAELPTLTAPVEKEELIVYLAAAKEAFRRRPYRKGFGAFAWRIPILVTISKIVLRHLKLLKVLKYNGEKIPFELEKEASKPEMRTKDIKRQILADFIVEHPEDDPLVTPMEVEEELSDPWILFDATYNEAEYEALIAGFWIAEQMGVKNLQANMDSCLVANQVNGSYIAKDPAIDYFTKWIEAKPVATITGNQCEKLSIRQHFASVKHPQANGLVERENRSLGEGIKAQLDKESKDWIEEVPCVLWAYRTMIKSSNGDTPFSLSYGTEAVIPTKIGMPTLRTQNEEARKLDLDLLEEKESKQQSAKLETRQRWKKYYN
nr:reverse transcriptase domain-containing protein [Tanacetum cinerariifolium]